MLGWLHKNEVIVNPFLTSRFKVNVSARRARYEMVELPSPALLLDCLSRRRYPNKASLEPRISAPAISTQLKHLKQQLGERSYWPAQDDR